MTLPLLLMREDVKQDPQDQLEVYRVSLVHHEDYSVLLVQIIMLPKEKGRKLSVTVKLICKELTHS